MSDHVKCQIDKADKKQFSLALSGNHIYLIISFCFLLPIVVITGYASEIRGIFFVALLSLLLTSASIWYLLRVWERRIQKDAYKKVKERLSQACVPSLTEEIASLRGELDHSRRGYEHQIDLLQSSVAKSKDEVHHLHLEMDKKLDEMRQAYLEFEDLRLEHNRLKEEYGQMNKESKKQLLHKESLIHEYQKTISEQRMILEKKQQYIINLENKVQDLMAEIRGLLQIDKSDNDDQKLPEENYFPVSYASTTPFDLSIQLQRFIQIAENETGVNHLGGTSPRFLNLTDSYAIDRRRLFDRFRDESGNIIFIFSLGEKKFLFVNSHVRIVLGWSPEKFIQEFPRLITAGYSELKKGLMQIGHTQEVQTHLAIQDRSGEQKEFTCIMGLISKGPFTNHVIGILSQ